MPQFDEFEGNVTVEAVDKKLADDTGLNYNFMVNVPFSENFAMRAVYTSGENPGIYQNVATGRKDIGTQEDDEYRLMFRYQNGPLDINTMVMKRERYDFGQKEKGNADKPGTADIVDANCSYDTAGTMEIHAQGFMQLQAETLVVMILAWHFIHSQMKHLTLNQP